MRRTAVVFTLAILAAGCGTHPTQWHRVTAGSGCVVEHNHDTTTINGVRYGRTQIRVVNNTTCTEYRICGTHILEGADDTTEVCAPWQGVQTNGYESSVTFAPNIIEDGQVNSTLYLRAPGFDRGPCVYHGDNPAGSGCAAQYPFP